MKMILSLVAITLMFGTVANAANKQEVWDLLQKVDNELRYYDQTSEALELVKIKLEDALLVLRDKNVPNPIPAECEDYTFDKMKNDGHSNAFSMEKARKFCRAIFNQNTDFEIVTFMFPLLHGDGFSANTSFNKIEEISRGLKSYQINCLSNAYRLYKDDGYTAIGALERAVGYCKR